MPLDDSEVPEPLTADEEYLSCLSEDIKNTQYRDNVLFYIGGWIVRKAHRINYCPECINCLVDFTWNGPLLLTEIKDYGTLYHPSKDHLKILKQAELMIRANMTFQKILSTTLKNFSETNSLFSNMSSHFASVTFQLHSHYFSLIKFVLESFFNMRMFALAKTKNTQRHTQSKRFTMNRLIINHHT